MNRHELKQRLKTLLIEGLKLEDKRPDDIEDGAPIFVEGLGLDSIDVLEMSLAISKAYGVQLRSDDPDNDKIFRSLRSLSTYVRSRRVK